MSGTTTCEREVEGTSNAPSAVDSLHTAIAAVGDLDLDALAAVELDELAVALQRARHRLAGVAARSLDRWEQRAVWRADGSRSAGARLGRDASMSVTSAQRELRRARALREMPAVAAAVEAGRLSPDHVDLLARADTPSRHEHLARDVALLVEQCATLRYAEAQRMVEYWRYHADAEGTESEAARSAERVHVNAASTLDGTVRVDGLLDPVGGSIFSTELRRLEREQHLADQAAGTVRTSGQRRAAALVQMASRSASATAGSKASRPLFTVLVGDETLSRLCELADGTVIAPGLLVPHLAAADLETVLFADSDTIISRSRRRTFTGSLRRAIQVRDRHCRHRSGCDVPAPDCDVDHIVPAAAHGITSQANGELKCPPHNRHPQTIDPGGVPRPERDVTWLDHWRAQLRWQIMHEPDPDDDDVDDIDAPSDGVVGRPQDGVA